MSDEDLIKKVENLKRRYKSIRGDHIAKDFYAPCLLASKKLKRATCDFTSSVLFQYGEALPKLVDVENESCQIEILAEPKLSSEDIKVLNEGLNKNKNIDDFYDEIQNRIIEDAMAIANGDQDRSKIFAVLAWLIKTKRLILKFAYVKHVVNSNLFHDKEGVFYLDWDNKKIGFNGSENETYSGMERNGGSFSLFKSWVPGQKEYVDDIEEAFDLAWENELDGLEVRNLNKKILEAIKSKAPENIKEFFKKNNFVTKENWRNYIKDLDQEDNRPFENAIAEDVRKKLKEKFLNQLNQNKEDYLEVTEKKWEFQKKARETFIEAKKGLLEMATGTGKTRTALSIATQLINEGKINKIIIQMKGTDLIRQWRDNIIKWTSSKISETVNFLEYSADKNEFDSFLLAYEKPGVDLILIRQSNFPDLLDKISDKDQSKTLVIHDEVHDLFAPDIGSKVIGKQNKFEYKLGLSATIREPFDKEREKTLFNEIQGGGEDPIVSYKLTQAIKDGVLVESKLIPLTYKLYPDEKSKITAHRLRYDKRIEEGVPKHEAEAERNIAISDVRKNARNKLEVFEENINFLKEKLHRSFIFADETDYGKDILNLLIPHINVKTHFQDADKKNLENFSKNKIDCIINVLKLSQGIDIQNLNCIVLFATPIGRQFIQRIGRVLRKDNDNPDKKAIIIDFFDEDDLKDEDEDSSDYRRYLELQEITGTSYEHRQ